MNLENILTPQDVYSYIDENIEYGYIDIDNVRHINNLKDFRRKYITRGIDDIIKEKIGTCIEQVFLMHYLLDKIGIKNKMFCTRVYEPDDYNNLEEDEHLHCFLLYFENGKVYHMEHPNLEKKGIYEYETENEAIEKIVDYYINLRGGKESPTKEFLTVPIGVSFREFNKYINHL